MLRLTAATLLALTAAARADVAEPSDPPADEAKPDEAKAEAPPADAPPAVTEEPAPAPMAVVAPSLVAPRRREPPPAPQPPADYTESYRGMIAVSDIAAVGLVLMAALTDDSGSRSRSTSLAELGVATYFIGAPMIHLLNDRGTHALASVGLRVGLPMVGLLVGEGLGHASCSDYCGSDADSFAVLGTLLGFVAASIVDAAVLAKGDEPPTATHVTAMPVHDGRGVTFGLTGSF